MNCFTGEALKTKLMAMDVLKSSRKRFCYTDLEKYIFATYDYRVMSLYGLKYTGKTTMMYQMIKQLDDYNHVCLIQCQPGERMYDLTSAMDAHPNCKYFFIEEATLLENFINTSAVLYEVYANMRVKVVLSGTNSLSFYVAKRDQLFDRTYMLHTTYISYKEYHYLLGRSLDDYIIHGGTLSDSKNHASDFYRGYLESAIIENLTYTLAHTGRAGEYGQLISAFLRHTIGNFLREVLDVYNRTFLAEIIPQEFCSNDMDSLEHLLNETSSAVEEAKQWLELMDVIYRIPSTIDKEHPEHEEVIFIQPGLRYWQLEAMVKELKASNALSAANEQEDVAYQLIMDNIKEHLLEDIKYYQQVNDKNIG